MILKIISIAIVLGIPFTVAVILMKAIGKKDTWMIILSFIALIFSLAVSYGLYYGLSIGGTI